MPLLLHPGDGAQSESLAYRSLECDSMLQARGLRCQKNYHRDNWLVATKRSQRRGFLILRCRLFLSWGRSWPQWLDCSPTNRERELGSDRRETGWLYPTDCAFHNRHKAVEGMVEQYERNFHHLPLVLPFAAKQGGAATQEGVPLKASQVGTPS